MTTRFKPRCIFHCLHRKRNKLSQTHLLDFGSQFAAINHCKEHFISISFIGYLKQLCWKPQHVLVLILREKIDEMFVPIGERPSCDPVDVQFMSEGRKRPLDDSFKSQIVRMSPLPGFGEET